jgi:hypothetical protein
MIRSLTLLLSLLALSSCEKRRTSERHLIPSGYEGVVITIYDQVGFPELPVRDGYRFYEYPEDGILITSTKQEYGRASVETFDVLADGTHRRITYDVGDRQEHFAASGSQEGGGEPKIEYVFKVIGSVEYWDRIDATEYDRKKEQAVRKLKSNQSKKSEQDAPSNGG